VFVAPTAVGAIERADIPVYLWDPDSPVDILVHNPEGRDLKLPEPYLPPMLEELLGHGATEADIATRVRVGDNVTFGVVYGDDANEGFNDPVLGADRRAAFEFAMEIWAARLQGPGFVSCSATMTPRGGDAWGCVLASCGPAGWYRDFSHAPHDDTWYPECLVEVISGTDPDTGQLDISVDFNSDVDNAIVLGPTDWYYGTDGNPGIHIDFVSTTIHELCHGIGFVSSFVSDGSYGGGTADPFVFDLYLVNAAGNQLISLATSPNNVVNPVRWAGQFGRYAYNNDFGAAGNVPMFAPNPWEGGSSISHLDEATFTGIWEMQTPYADGVCHVPDSIVMGILQDIGYSLPVSRYVHGAATGFEDGSSQNPFDTLAEGVADAPAGGVVRMFPGSYDEPMTITKEVELHSACGTAVIGE